MLEVVSITFRAFGKVRFKDIVIPNQMSLFGDFNDVKRSCVGDPPCDDFCIINIKFKKVEVFP